MKFLDDEPTHVYAIRADDGEMLWIGQTTHPDRRLREHRQTFGNEVTMVMVALLPRRAALLLEEKLIRELRPSANKIHNPDSGYTSGGHGAIDVVLHCHWLGCDAATANGRSLCVHHASLRDGKASGVGRGNGRALTDDDRAEIRERLARFESPVAIAKEFGISRSTVLRAAARARAS